MAAAFGRLRPEEYDGPSHRPSTELDGTMSTVGLGRANAFRVTGTPQIVRRTRRSITDAPLDPLKVCIQHTGRAVVHQGDVEVAIGPGQLALYDTGRPYDLRLEGEWTCWVMTLPRDALGMPAATVIAAMARPFCADVGPGSVLAHLLASSLESAPGGPAGAEQLGEAAVYIMASLLRGPDVPPAAVDDAQRAQVLAYVRAHLQDPDLGHTQVARAHGMSSRSLHRLFESEPQTVAETIRTQRLDAIRAEMVDPVAAGRSTMSIAHRWGYHDQAHFTRAFRARFGVTPAALRRGTGER